MTPSRFLIASIVATAIVGGVGGLSATATAQQDVAVTGVNITPADPMPGDRVTLTTTIENLQSSNETIQVTDVYVRSDERGELARVEDLGSVAVGSSMTVPLSTTFNSQGEKDLRIHVVVRDSDGVQRIEHPAYVTVSSTDSVQLGIRGGDFVAGETRSVNVTVANGGSSPISNVRLELDSDGQVENPTRVSGTIPAETNQEYSYDVQFAESGTGSLEASLRYSLPGDVTRTTSETVDVAVDSATATTEGRIHLSSIEMAGGNVITISGEAANVGTTDAQSVLLSVRETEDVTPVSPSGDYFVGTIEGSEFGTFELTAEVSPDTESVPILVEWTVDDERRSEVMDIDVSSSRPANGGQFGGGTPDGDISGDEQPESGPSGPFAGIGLWGIVGALVLLVVLGLGYRWKRQ